MKPPRRSCCTGAECGAVGVDVVDFGVGVASDGFGASFAVGVASGVLGASAFAVPSGFADAGVVGFVAGVLAPALDAADVTLDDDSAGFAGVGLGGVVGLAG